jgi:uncharacterized protein (TIGR03000 family)
VGKGQVFFESGERGVRLTAPPGPALVRWNTIDKQPEVQRMEKVPPELSALASTEGEAFAAICAACAGLTTKELGPALDALMASGQKAERLVGVTTAGAVDDLPRVIKGMGDAKHADLRDHAVIVLRHWLGRGKGQLERLHQSLLKQGVSDVRARTLLQLVLGFDQEQQTRPETYELLLHSLQHPRVEVRELARWHLVRLAPAGRAFGFDAAAPEAARQKAVAQWQRLIPEGQLPRRDLPPGDPAQQAVSARLKVLVPADATVTVDGHATRSTGAERQFVSPPLQPGRKFTYTLEATWKENGQLRRLTRRVTVEAGGGYVVDFRKDGSGNPR